MVLASWQPIPHGRPYRYHLNGSVHMMTTRNRVGPLPTRRLAVRHSVDYSSLDHFSLDDSSRDSSSSSSSETSLDSSADVLFDYASTFIFRSFITNTIIGPSHDSSSMSPSRKRSRSPAASAPLSLPIPEALSYARTDLEMDVDVVMSDGIDINLEIQAKIEECIAHADVLRNRGIDDRVVVEVVDRDKVETVTRGPVEVRVDRVTHPVTVDDIPEPAQEAGDVEVTYETLGDLV
nr:hypothetical protein [Tanacetum cinerariifolium]